MYAPVNVTQNKENKLSMKRNNQRSPAPGPKSLREPKWKVASGTVLSVHPAAKLTTTTITKITTQATKCIAKGVVTSPG